MIKRRLREQIGTVPATDRVQESIGALLDDAVFSFYFAKCVWSGLQDLASAEPVPLSNAYDHIQTSLVKQCVIGIAYTIDQTAGWCHSLEATTELNRGSHRWGVGH